MKHRFARTIGGGDRRRIGYRQDNSAGVRRTGQPGRGCQSRRGCGDGHRGSAARADHRAANRCRRPAPSRYPEYGDALRDHTHAEASVPNIVVNTTCWYRIDQVTNFTTEFAAKVVVINCLGLFSCLRCVHRYRCQAIRSRCATRAESFAPSMLPICRRLVRNR